MRRTPLRCVFSYILFFLPYSKLTILQRKTKQNKTKRNTIGNHQDFRMKFICLLFDQFDFDLTLNNLTWHFSQVSPFMFFDMCWLFCYQLSIQLSLLFFRLMKIHVLWLSRQKSCSSRWCRALSLNLYRSLCPDSQQALSRGHVYTTDINTELWSWGLSGVISQSTDSLWRKRQEK